MRNRSASLGYFSLAIALIVAPLPVTNALLPLQTTSAADACCGCCPDGDTAREQVIDAGCCSRGAHGNTDKQDTDEPASSEPCESDCGQCPCCAAVVPVPPAILPTAGQPPEPAQVAAVVTDRILLSTRSDEPLLPPPRG